MWTNVASIRALARRSVATLSDPTPVPVLMDTLPYTTDSAAKPIPVGQDNFFDLTDRNGVNGTNETNETNEI